jgi:hypothetical protein
LYSAERVEYSVHALPRVMRIIVLYDRSMRN